MNEIRSLSYSGNSLQFRVEIAGINHADVVADMDAITHSLDYPDLTEYKVRDTTITLNDPQGLFAPNNDNNFFVRQGLNQDGIGAVVEVKSGYDDLETIFKGRVFYVMQDSVEGIVELFCKSDLHKLFRDQIVDYGLEKQFMLELNDEQETINGEYPIAEWALPASDESVEVNKSVGNALTQLPELSEQGALNPDNYKITRDGIETEGGAVRNPATGYPQITMKSPHRYREVEVVLREVLASAGITNVNTEIPEVDVGDHFSNNGRVAYSLVGTQQFGSSNPLTWQGFVTGVLYDDGKMYFAYSPRLGDFTNRAMIVERDQSTGVERVLYRAPASTRWTTQFWSIAKSGNNLSIMATDAGVEQKDFGDLPDVPKAVAGSYDARHSGNRIYILNHNISTGTTITLVQKNATLKAQLAHYYNLGQTRSDFRSLNRISAVLPQRSPFMLPDTRKGIQWHGTNLYYPFVSTTHAGVARVGLTSPAQSIVSFPFGGGHQVGLSFDIAGNTLIVVANYKEGSQSRRIGLRRDIS